MTGGYRAALGDAWSSDWWVDAACAGTGSELFYDGEPADARLLCNGADRCRNCGHRHVRGACRQVGCGCGDYAPRLLPCPVRDLCLAAALDAEGGGRRGAYGVWGGLTPGQRATYRRKHPLPVTESGEQRPGGVRVGDEPATVRTGSEGGADRPSVEVASPTEGGGLPRSRPAAGSVRHTRGRAA